MQAVERAPSVRRGRRARRRPAQVWLSSCRDCGRLHEPRDWLRDSSVCTHCSDAARSAPAAR
jgi:hypothetical protein